MWHDTTIKHDVMFTYKHSNGLSVWIYAELTGSWDDQDQPVGQVDRWEALDDDNRPVLISDPTQQAEIESQARSALFNHMEHD